MSLESAIRDGVSFHSSPRAIRPPMIKTISAVQDEAPHIQLLAVAAALVVLSDAVGINPHDLVTRISRMSRDIDAPFSNQWQGMRDYARGELLK